MNTERFFEDWLKKCYDEFSQEHKAYVESGEQEVYVPVPDDIINQHCVLFARQISDWITSYDDLFEAVDSVIRQNLDCGSEVYEYVFNRHHKRKGVRGVTMSPEEWIKWRKELGANSTRITTSDGKKWTLSFIQEFKSCPI